MGTERRCRWAAVFVGNLVATVTPLAMGYHLAPATITTMLLGCVLVVPNIIQIPLGYHFQTIGSAVAVADRYRQISRDW
jgi:hypothetical protein